LFWQRWQLCSFTLWLILEISLDINSLSRKLSKNKKWLLQILTRSPSRKFSKKPQKCWERQIQTRLSKISNLLQSYWLQVVRNHVALQKCDNIDSTNYMKKGIFSDTKKHYIITRIKIKEFLQNKELPKLSTTRLSTLNIEILRSKL
jgi:hypothetical protein